MEKSSQVQCMYILQTLYREREIERERERERKREREFSLFTDSSFFALDPTLPLGSYEPAIDIDQQTDSNHDTALTLASAGQRIHTHTHTHTHTVFSVSI